MELNLTAYGVALIPVIVGVVELLKRIGLPVKWAPLAALALGQAAGLLYVAPGDPLKGVLAGVVLALAAVGLWSGPKNTVEGFGASGEGE